MAARRAIHQDPPQFADRRAQGDMTLAGFLGPGSTHGAQRHRPRIVSISRMVFLAPVAHEDCKEPPPIRTIFNIQANHTQNNT